MTSWSLRALLLYICVVAVCHATHKQTGANPELISCLDKIQGLDVVLPTDPQYKEDTSVWELKIPQSFPLVVIVPKSASQIQSAVKCAQDAKVRVVPKSGGHSYEGYSVQTDTLAVDLINMDDVKADKKSGIVTAGAGATLGMLYYYSWFDAGMGFNAGTCPPVGVSGFMLGGGFGYYSRKAGMSCDNVVSFQMVAYDGKLLTVSKSQNKDMFWAMCGGGGGNFGIVTSWKIKMMSVPSTIQYASVTYEDSVDTAADVANYFQTWASSVDTNLGSELHVGPNNAAAKLFFYYAGSGSLSEIIDASKLSTLGSSPPKISYKSYSWIDAVMAQSGWGLTNPKQLLQRSWPSEQDYRKEKSYYVYPPGWSTSLYKSLFEQMQQMYATGGNIKFRTAGGQIAKVSPTATAFPHRKALGWVIMKGEWGSAGESEKDAYAWLNAAASTVKAAKEPDAAYVNYIDSGLKNWQTAYYGSNYKKLQSVKSKFDPQDMFTYPDQGIKGKSQKTCTYTPCEDSSS